MWYDLVCVSVHVSVYLFVIDFLCFHDSIFAHFCRSRSTQKEVKFIIESEKCYDEVNKRIETKPNE